MANLILCLTRYQPQLSELWIGYVAASADFGVCVISIIGVPVKNVTVVVRTFFSVVCCTIILSVLE